MRALILLFVMSVLGALGCGGPTRYDRTQDQVNLGQHQQAAAERAALRSGGSGLSLPSPVLHAAGAPNRWAGFPQVARPNGPRRMWVEEDFVAPDGSIVRAPVEAPILQQVPQPGAGNGAAAAEPQPAPQQPWQQPQRPGWRPGPTPAPKPNEGHGSHGGGPLNVNTNVIIIGESEDGDGSRFTFEPPEEGDAGGCCGSTNVNTNVIQIDGEMIKAAVRAALDDLRDDDHRWFESHTLPPVEAEGGCCTDRTAFATALDASQFASTQKGLNWKRIYGRGSLPGSVSRKRWIYGQYVAHQGRGRVVWEFWYKPGSKSGYYRATCYE